ncbi:hypothetical protein JXI42_13285 [bacterium]|nr:hypothetical protein [bacterium]
MKIRTLKICISVIMLLLFAGGVLSFQGEYRDIPLNELLEQIAAEGGYIVDVPSEADWLASFDTGTKDVPAWKALHIVAAAYGLTLVETDKDHFRTEIIGNITGDPAVYRTTGMQPVSGGDIKKGIVWAYGKKVEPPYSIEVTSDEVTLCGVTIYPTPVRESPVPPMTADILEEHDLSGRIIDIGNEQGLEKAAEFALQSSLVDEAVVIEDAIEITYTDGEEELLYFGEMKHGTGERTISEENLSMFADAVKEILEDEGMVAFGYNYYRSYPSKDYGQDVDKRILDALSSGGRLRDKYSRIFGATWEKDFTLEIIHNN